MDPQVPTRHRGWHSTNPQPIRRNVIAPASLDKERDPEHRRQQRHDRPSSSSYQGYTGNHSSHHKSRRHEEEANWLVRSPSASAAAAPSSSSSSSSSSSTRLPSRTSFPPIQASSMEQSRSVDSWPRSSSSSSRLPPPAHYDQRIPRASVSGSERRRHDDETGGSALLLNVERHSNSSVGVVSGYYTSGAGASFSGIAPSTTNSTSPSGLSTSSTSTGSGSCSSSLRTPPDLAVLHHGGLMPGGKEYEGSVAALSVPAHRYLSVKEIEERLELLASLEEDARTIDVNVPAEPGLPSPPRPTAAKVAIKLKQSQADAATEEIAKPEQAYKDELKLVDTTTASAMPSALKCTSSSVSVSTAPKRKSNAIYEEGKGSQQKKRSKICPDEEVNIGSVAVKQGGKAPSKYRSRKEGSSTRDYDTPSPSVSPPPSKEWEVNASIEEVTPGASSTSPTPAKVSRNLVESVACTLSPRTWTKDDFARIAHAYQARGRSLKHSGDNRVRSAQPSSSSSARAIIQRVANYEQTEAILLYMYAFWCEDHAVVATSSRSSAKAGCIPANWTSLSGLLHYVCANHEKANDLPLAGLCRFLEAVALKHVASHEMRQLSVRLARSVSRSMSSVESTLASAVGPGTGNSTASPASQASPQTCDGHEHGHGMARAMQQDLSDASSTLAKIVADEERCARLVSAARVTLNPVVLAKRFPKTWEQCMSSGLSMDLARTARDLDPSRMSAKILAPTKGEEGGAEEEEEETEAPQACWAYPLEVIGGPIGAVVLVPHLVNFARALLREGAARARLDGYSIAQGLP